MAERMPGLLHGGPVHGKRITVNPSCDRIVVPHLPRLPAVKAEPRPSWWRLLARWRWHRRPLPIPEPPAYQNLTYRYLATNDRGTRIYAHDPYARMPGAGEPSGPDLHKYLVDHMYSVHPADRWQMTWVMNTEWLNEVRATAESLGYQAMPGQPEIVLGLPVKVTKDGGIPHLVRWPDD